MKCELAAALLHRPRVLFLDEPTIGLDVSMQAVLRGFVRAYNQRYGATVLLTSHYMEDVVALCPRVLVIDRGHLRYDGQLAELSHSLRPEKLIRLRFSRSVPAGDLARFGSLVSRQEDGALFKIQHPELRDTVARMLAELPVSDLTVEDPPIEDVMRDLFSHHEAAAS
jgi:ABC-2 type transport system ATP-binding protein